MEFMLTYYRKRVVGILLVISAVLLSSCASSRESAQKLADAEKAMQRIEQMQAMDHANAEFKEAQIRLEEARQFKERGKHRKAIMKADEAMVAADLAEVKTLSQKAEASISELQTSIQSLKEQLKQYEQDQ